MKQPWEFKAALTDSRLGIIASILLDVYHRTHSEMQSDLDDGYTRGTATFGRTKNRIIQVCLSNEYEWLSLMNPGNDVTFGIKGIPCRFFRDEHDAPSTKVFRRNAVDDLFPSNDEDPVMFRFIVEHPATPDDEPKVFFIGLTQDQVLVASWAYTDKVRVFTNVGDVLPASVTVEAYEPTLKTNEQSTQKKSGT